MEGDRVHIAFEIDPGAFKRVVEVVIEGNRMTSRGVIRRELMLDEGDPVSRIRILESQQRLSRLGIFRNVRLGYRPAEGRTPEEQTLSVVVEEAEPMSTRLGGGYDSEAGPQILFSLTNHNLGGHNRELGLQGKFSSIERKLRVVAKEPYLFTEKLPTLFNLSWSLEEEVGFTEDRRTFSMRVDRRFTHKWTGFARYALNRIDLSDITDLEAVEEERLEDIRLASIGVAVARNTYDHPFLATKGSRWTAGVNLFPRVLLSEESFVQSTVTASRLFPVPSRVTFATSFRLGLAAPLDDTPRVPISERFFAGGDSTIRGFPRDTVGPKTENGTPTGGEGLLIVNLECRFPIWRRLTGVTFYDAGNVYATLSDFDVLDVRHVLGAGLHLITPIGPVRLEYGRKLDREAEESAGELFLSFGNAF